MGLAVAFGFGVLTGGGVLLGVETTLELCGVDLGCVVAIVGSGVGATLGVIVGVTVAEAVGAEVGVTVDGVTVGVGVEIAIFEVILFETGTSYDDIPIQASPPIPANAINPITTIGIAHNNLEGLFVST